MSQCGKCGKHSGQKVLFSMRLLLSLPCLQKKQNLRGRSQKVQFKRSVGGCADPFHLDISLEKHPRGLASLRGAEGLGTAGTSRSRSHPFPFSFHISVIIFI